MTRELVHEDLRVDRPLSEDVIFIYRLRAFRVTDDATSEVTYEQEYGGFPSWYPYSGYDILDMTQPGVIAFDGPTWQDLQLGLVYLTDLHRGQLLSAREEIDRILRGQ